MIKILCFGNEFIEGDTLAKEIANLDVEGIEFVKCNHPDEILGFDEPIILDVVKGIKEPILIEDPEQLKGRKISTMHDFDLGFFIKLITAVDSEIRLKVIGIPMEGDAKELTEEIKILLKNTDKKI